MNIDFNELFEQYFSKEFMDSNKDKFSQVIDHIKKCTNEFTLNVDGENIDAVLEKSKNPDYRLNYNIKLNENGIHVLQNFNDFWNLIKNHIPRTIRKISIPLYGAGIDISFFSEFPNLEEIDINDYGMFDIDELEYLSENTKVKNINGKSIYSLKNKKNTISSNAVVAYKDIIIKNTSSKTDVENEEYVYLEASELNLEQMSLLMSQYPKLKDVDFSVNNDRYIFKFNGKDVSLRVVSSDLNISSHLNDALTKMGYNVSKIEVSIENSDHKIVEYTKFDYSILDELAKKTELFISYDKSFIDVSSYDEFKGLVESMKWYKSIITDYKLSPLEKLTFAYDIMKTFQYNESEKDKKDSRNPHRIIDTGHIVCVGYADMLNEILKGIDSNLKVSSFGCSCFEDDDKTLKGHHQRTMVRIDDDKYNVHGIYVLDATWDSIKRNGKEVYGNDYDALSVYKYFMVPFTEYETYFPHDSRPDFFSGKLSILNDDLTSENIRSKADELAKNSEVESGELPQEEDSKKLFNEYRLQGIIDMDEEVQSSLASFDSRRLSFEEFLELIKNVRLSEGYKQEEVESEINKIARINSRYFNHEYIEESEIKLE